MTTRRQRTDGTWTHADEAWDRKWYWPIGTRVTVPVRGGVQHGTVTKTNPTTAWVTFDSGRAPVKVPMTLLTRITPITSTTDAPTPEHRWIIRCRVSGGVTGTRESVLKANDVVKYFPDENTARTEADRLSRDRNDMFAVAYFQYWPEQETR